MTDKEYNTGIDIGNLLTVMKQLALMEEDFALRVAKKWQWNVDSLLKNYRAELANRANNAIDAAKANEKLQMMIDDYTDEEREAFKLVSEASRFLEQNSPDGLYRAQTLQLHMIAKICATKGFKLTLSEHPPGTGKSFIAALLIAYYHLKSNALQFLVLTSSEVLKTQLS